MTERRFPVLDGGMTVPWAMLEPHEPQARANHDQSLKRLAERGGLGWSEMLAVLEGKGCRCVMDTSDAEAKPRVLARVATFEADDLSRELAAKDARIQELEQIVAAWRGLAESCGNYGSLGFRRPMNGHGWLITWRNKGQVMDGMIAEDTTIERAAIDMGKRLGLLEPEAKGGG